MTTYLNLDLHNKQLKNVGTPSVGSDGLDRDYADSRYINVSGVESMAGPLTISGNLIVGGTLDVGNTIDMNNTKITRLATPTLTYDAANKYYVDTHTYTSFRNWLADDTLDMDWEDIINVWDLEIDGNNLWLDGTDIENTGDIDSDNDSTYDIGTNLNRYANVYADDLWGTTHDLEWTENICPICKNKFEEGEFLIQVVSGVGLSLLGRKKDVTRTVPVHLNCVNNLQLKEEKQQKEDIKNMMGQIVKLREELLELKRQKDEENKKKKEEKRRLKLFKRGSKTQK